ncbi:hypothetical protein SIN01_05220 [Sporolactobacillus inulinus]|nr:hypothetical protein SIN01_05220 [Sporolactobacillus inulinus]
MNEAEGYIGGTGGVYGGGLMVAKYTPQFLNCLVTLSLHISSRLMPSVAMKCLSA